VTASSTTLLDAIGGEPTVAGVVDELYLRLTHDQRVRHHFAPSRLEHLKAAQRRWFAAVLSGAAELPSDLRSAHEHLDITDDDVSVVIGHLADILAGTSLSPRVQRAVLSVVGRLWYARRF
jgi:truncated hemoglobin YjbI